MHAVTVPPSTWIARFAPLVRPGAAVLDLAAGSGRHGRMMRDLGHPVVFLDRDISPLADLGDDPGTRLVCRDLETGDAGDWLPEVTPAGGFGAIVVTNYLHRPLLPLLPGLLAAGGVLLYETFAVGNEVFGKPSNPDFLLRPNELAQMVVTATPALSLIAAEHGRVETPKPAVISRIAALRPLGGQDSVRGTWQLPEGTAQGGGARGGP